MYPFRAKKYEIPTGINIKKALTIDDVMKIINYNAEEGSIIEKCRDYWLFSYLCNGINMKDIANLKFSNIDGEFITFVRAKTKRKTKSNPKLIKIFILPEIRKILDKWANTETKPSDLVFPIISPEMTPEKPHSVIRQFIKQVNKHMRKIAGDLEIEKDVTTYTARHTYSTVLKRSGVNTEFISESLGHASLKTTQSYLDSFEDEKHKTIAQSLIKK